MEGGGIASAVMSGIGSLFNLGTGISQILQGKKIQKRLDAQGRPILETPEAFNEYESLVRNRALNPQMPGQTALEQGIQDNTANQLANIQQTAGNSNQALIAGLMANKLMNNNLTNIGVQAAQQQQANMHDLYNTLGQKSNLQQQQFQYNVQQPYEQEAAQAKALKQAGMTNTANAIKDSAMIGYALDNSNKNNDIDNNKTDISTLFGIKGSKNPANNAKTPANNITLPIWGSAFLKRLKTNVVIK